MQLEQTELVHHFILDHPNVIIRNENNNDLLDYKYFAVSDSFLLNNQQLTIELLGQRWVGEITN